MKTERAREVLRDAVREATDPSHANGAEACPQTPVSRRDIGRARWFVAAVGVATVAMTAKLTVMLFPVC